MDKFIELAEPEEVADGVWEVCRADDLAGFLHLNGELYQDVVSSDNSSHGWFQSEISAQTASLMYYNKHNVVYPHDLSLTLNTILDLVDEQKSKIMEFL